MNEKAELQSSGYAEILTRINDRAADAVLSKGRVQSYSLRKELAQRLYDGGDRTNAFVADPVFEAIHIWQRADVCLDDLSGNLLEEDLVAALDQKFLQSGIENSQRWPRSGSNVAPYAHQLRAWQVADLGKSYMVTSGTGSGKTECFMIPMINDLLRNYKPGNSGIEAIILYPLNALIDSQKERLSAWIEPLANRLSYALYNRHLPEHVPSPQKRGAEIRDRNTMRISPPPLLVTNVTMLEYMLMRAQDRALLEKSQGSLRWIVLDEAHSYVGAQAAEMALLLRRVRQAFGVQPQDVRLAATSATLGEGEETRNKLREFLADLAGLKPEEVEVIEGSEMQPNLPPIGNDTSIIPHQLPNTQSELWQVLSPHPRIRKVREAMRSGGVNLQTAGNFLGFDTSEQTSREKTLKLLEAAAQACDPLTGVSLAPWRLHVFHRAQGGIWACIDPNCPDKGSELIHKDSDWPFGQVHLKNRERCTCSAPVFEIGACDECGTPWLIADISNEMPHRFLRSVADQQEEDDYILDVEPDLDDEGTLNISHAVEKAVVVPSIESTRDFIRLSDAALFEHPPKEDRVVPLSIFKPPSSRKCCEKSKYEKVIVRPQRFGSPFLMGNAIPLLLEAASSNSSKNLVPFNGRRLLSFTDSRQGTARFSAKLQQEVERTLIRSIIYHSVQDRTDDPGKAEKLQKEIEGLRQAINVLPILADTLAEKESALVEAKGGLKTVSWNNLVEKITQNEEHKNFACLVWKNRPQKGDNTLAENPRILAELFLYRELFRRPRLQNNVESMGLAKLIFPEIEKQAQLNTPKLINEIGYNSDVWIDLLYAAVDLVFRSKLAIDLPETPVNFRHWIAPHDFLSKVIEPSTSHVDSNSESQSVDSNIKSQDVSKRRIPRCFPTSINDQSYLVKMIYRIIEGNSQTGINTEYVTEILAEIWKTLCESKTIQKIDSVGWCLDLTQASITAVETAYQCPTTRRLLPYAPAGISMNAIDEVKKVKPIEMPMLFCSSSVGISLSQREEIRNWLKKNTQIHILRLEGLWTNLHDRAAEFAQFFRAQEHSAQIDRNSLQTYEQEFKEGNINILNCSTTMEMGVDIPNVELVVNTNVPPAPTNYRQRIGRAGRRGEPWTLAFTFCKDLPIDNMIFHDPHQLLKAEIAAPEVRLDSAIVVQRHVNALLLGLYLRKEGGVNIKTNMGSFTGATSDLKSSILPGNQADAFALALKSKWRKEDEVKSSIEVLVRGTCLKGLRDLVEITANNFNRFLEHWRTEYKQLLEAQSAYLDNEPAHWLYRKRAKRMRDEFMIAELAKRGFTPSYGFPVDVVSFDHAGSDSENVGPSRQLDMAIREYSPGCEVVIDGLVHLSEGVLPTWGNRNDPSNLEDLRTLFMCKTCGLFGTNLYKEVTCPRCEEKSTQQRELLRPSGFLGTRKPHSAYEKLDFVPPDIPRISADPENWITLPDPDVGRYRTAREGRVLITSSGKHGRGYAICITCGRTESENSEDNPALPSKMKNHIPLQKLPNNPRDDGKCPGNDESSRKIRRQVKLGHEMTTDVFELQLYALANTKAGKAKALCIASALRETLAKRLGIDAEMMGISAAPSLGINKVIQTSIFLYDKASGGSGFAISADQNVPAILRQATQFLKCNTNCESGCSECILRRDLQFSGTMKRKEALKLMNLEVLPRLEIPQRLKFFDTSTKVITQPFNEWMFLKLNSGLEEVTLFLTAPPTLWDITEWPGLQLIREISQRRIPAKIVLRTADFTALEISQKLDLVRLTAYGNTTIHSVAELPKVHGCKTLAWMKMNGTDISIVCPDDGAACIDKNWGNTKESPLISGIQNHENISKPISLEKIAELNEVRSAYKNITNELDGPVAKFGSRFWTLIQAMRPQVFSEGRRISQATYNDRYLRSPLTTRLLFEVWRTMPLKNADTNLRIVTEQLNYDGRRAYKLYHNWENDQLRRAIMLAMFPRSTIKFRSKSDCAHARFLKLTFDDNSVLDIYLDQGFGAWQERSSREHFVQDLDTEKITKNLLRCKFSVDLREKGKLPSPIWLRW